MTCKRPMQRLLASIACSLLALTLLVGWQRESPTPSTEKDEQAIREATERELASLEPTSDLEKHLLGHLSCATGKVEVKGDVATLVVSVTNTDLPKAIAKAQEDVVSPEKLDTLGELYRAERDPELYEDVLQLVYACIDESKDTVTKDVTLVFARHEGDEWVLDEKCDEEFAKAAYAGLL